MRRTAQVASIAALRDFRAALVTFVEEARVALDEAEFEIQRTAEWLRHDQISRWKAEARRWAEEVTRAKSELYRRQITASADDAKPSAVDEKKRLEYVQRRRDEAESKIIAVQRWERTLAHEAAEYRGPTRQLATAVELELPQATQHLARLIESLERYVRLAVPETDAASAPHSGPTASEPPAPADDPESDDDV
ncbi:MAG: hypothetical protein KAS72_03065 [Phycisphaerales bacterium]|nr:hypothetical protein [Phycisphaerales bacterium]